MDPREAAWRTTLAFAFGMLIAQFLLGMAVNLFVTIPTNHAGAHPPEYFGGVVTSVSWAIQHGDIWLRLHAILGLLIVLGALGTLVQAIRIGGGARITYAAIGLVGVLAAGFNGGSFLNYNENFSSMLMAVGFALGLTMYLVLLFRSPGRAAAR